MNEILRSYEERTGKTLRIRHIPRSELEKQSGIAAALGLCWDKGQGVVGETLDNDLYPGWSPKTVLEYIT